MTSEEGTKFFKKPHLWVWLLFFPALSFKGWSSWHMFLDGLTYGAVSRNWASGSEEIWQLHYTSYLYDRFVEHPPLFFWLEGSLFWLLGDQTWIEELTMMVIFVTTFFLLAKMIFKRVTHESMTWALAVLIIPGVYWSFQNNMLEPLLTLGFLLAIYPWIVNGRGGQVWISVFGTWVALLTKGVVGLPIVILPVVYLMIGSKLKSVLIYYALFITLAGLIFLIPGASEFFSLYWEKQIAGSLQQGVNQVGFISRLGPLLLALLIIGVLYAIGAWRNLWRWEYSRQSLPILILTGMYTLPWFVFQKFNPHYYFPSYLLMWLYIGMNLKLSQWKVKNSAVLGIIILSGIAGQWLAPKARIAVELASMDLFMNEEVVPVSKELCTDWYLHAAFQRVRQIDIQCSGTIPQISVKSIELSCTDPIQLEQYYLCKDE